jgi:hypothetical protein
VSPSIPSSPDCPDLDNTGANASLRRIDLDSPLRGPWSSPSCPPVDLLTLGQGGGARWVMTQSEIIENRKHLFNTVAWLISSTLVAHPEIVV